MNHRYVIEGVKCEKTKRVIEGLNLLKSLYSEWKVDIRSITPPRSCVFRKLFVKLRYPLYILPTKFYRNSSFPNVLIRSTFSTYT